MTRRIRPSPAGAVLALEKLRGQVFEVVHRREEHTSSSGLGPYYLSNCSLADELATLQANELPTT